MPCFHPRTVWRSPRRVHPKSGKPRVFFKKPSFMFDESFKTRVNFFDQNSPLITPKEFYQPEEFQIPGCKPKCVGCQEAYSRQWAVRSWHESQRHDLNCFITLTFNDKYCPKNGLDHRWFQLFMKRLRKSFSADARQAKRVRVFMCGEYGSLNFRPHFHACLFGIDFPDRKLWSIRDEVHLYTSDMLSALWSVPRGFKNAKKYPKGFFPKDAIEGESFGFSTVGDVTFESAAYIARYVGKKINGDKKDDHYQGRKPEYSKMSLKPGLGKDWFLAYQNSVFPEDAVTLRGGTKCKPPRYYDKIFELTNPVMSSSIKSVRKTRAANSPDNSPERLRAREKVKQAQIKQLKRSL